MSIFLDSASAEDARQAAALGFVRGVTTNPALMARQDRPAFEVIAALADLSTGPVFYQLTGPTVQDREAEARGMAALRPNKIGLKIPSTLENFRLAEKLVSQGYLVGMTAIFSAAQVYLACQVGARYVLPYVNRSTRLLGSGPALVEQMRRVIEAEGSSLEILAASIKSPEEAVEALLAGAHHLTLPLAQIEALGEHHLSHQAIEEFRQAMEK